MHKHTLLPILSLLLLCSSNAMADKTVLAGGCFWCMESDFEKLSGVSDVVSGFTGGSLKDPTYHGNHSGHYEAVEITYDPKKVSYQALLDYYWHQVDPFDASGQFCDKGSSYLSAIFVANKAERLIAEQSRQNMIARFPNQTLITPILTASKFYPIQGEESYHQDYYKKNPIRYHFYRSRCGRDQRLSDIWANQSVTIQLTAYFPPAGVEKCSQKGRSCLHKFMACPKGEG
ncbi:MAG: peptide-methionine (S)-S-oxide reductase MsrA [Mariprofundaceae bacterium]